MAKLVYPSIEAESVWAGDWDGLPGTSRASTDGGPRPSVRRPLVEQRLQLQNGSSDTVVAPWLAWRTVCRRVATYGGYGLAVVLVALSAIIVKEYQHAPALAGIQRLSAAAVVSQVDLPAISDPLNGDPLTAGPLNRQPNAESADAQSVAVTDPMADVVVQVAAQTTDEPAWKSDPNIRWFNGRPVRPAKVIRMVVTAYSPDARSCDDSADGITATLHSVETNGFALVAADPRLLKYGSLLTVPGYDKDRIVPVLDCGGKIKGKRLDVLYPTHAQARKWGKKTLDVTVWEYADGLPAPNPRKLR